mgnify:CR=1 FL=1
MTSKLDVLALSEMVEHDSHSGDLRRQLLAQGNTLYGIDPQTPDYLSQITPDGVTSIGYWHDGKFVAIYCLMPNIS